MAVGFRILCVLILIASLSSCLSVGLHDAPLGTALPLASASIASSSHAPLVFHEEILQPALGHSGAKSSDAFLLLSAGSELSASSITLSANADGSISVHANGRSVSPLRGLDPSLVNPDLLPFLFPSCDVPSVLFGVTR